MSDNFLGDDPVTRSRADEGQGRDLHDNEPVGDVAPESLAREHEVEDVNVRAILQFAGALTLITVLILVALWWLLQIWTQRDLAFDPQIPPVIATPRPVPGPGVEAEPVAELEALWAEQRQRLTTYGWVDQEAGVVHIPLDQAKALLLEQGVPARETAVPHFGLDQAYELESEGGQEFAGEFEVETNAAE